MSTNTEKRTQLEIKVRQDYFDLSDFRRLEGRIVKSVREGKCVLLDLTRAEKGVRGDVFGELFQRIRDHYSNDVAALEAARQVTLLFTSRTAPAYQSLQRGYEGLFSVEFIE